MPIIDIIDMHEKIKNYFQSQEKLVPDYQKKIENLETYINENQLNEVSKNKIRLEINHLKSEIDNIITNKTLCFYLNETDEIITDYKKIIEKPIVMSFFGKSDDSSNEKNEIIIRYIKACEKYVDLNLFRNCIEKSPAVKQKICCKECNNKNVELIEKNIIVCLGCGYQNEITKNSTSYKDVKRVNISSKYTYERKIHFKDCINQYQGKQNSTIPPILLETIDKLLESHGLLEGDENTPKNIRYKKVKKDHILIFLKETGNSKYYEDVFLIFHLITGKKLDDISHLEANLLEDFDTLTNLYDKKFKQNKKINRKSFINTQYVLYQLLKKYKHPCKKEDFNILKTLDRKSFHDDICKELFEELGWNFTPSF